MYKEMEMNVKEGSSLPLIRYKNDAFLFQKFSIWRPSQTPATIQRHGKDGRAVVSRSGPSLGTEATYHRQRK